MSRGKEDRLLESYAALTAGMKRGFVIADAVAR